MDDIGQKMLSEWDKLIAKKQGLLNDTPCKPWRTFLVNEIERLTEKRDEYKRQLRG